MKKFLLISILLVLSGEIFAAIRIVSLSPAVTDAIVEIGAVDLLCGRSRVCDAPGTANIPIAGDMGFPVVEKILRLRATHVVSDTRHPGGNWKFLEQRGIKLIFLPGKKIADFPENLRILGKLIKREKSAGIAAEKFEKKIAALRNAKIARRPRVLAVFAIPPVISCGKNSFVNEALEVAGAENICGRMERSYFTLSTEYIIKAAPEAIIIAGVPEKAVREYFKRPEFRSLPAVKQQRFIMVAPDEFCRAGSKLPEAIRQLKKVLSLE